ncbi:MAG TPA: hypothetical protein VEC57_12460 [Candidatus Limnocylindrales bacterium]|nr:hypothetical protein [Candidatus Limnocylindrales bacterium]
MFAIILRLPILIACLLTAFAARCDNLHAESRDAALAAFEASRRAAGVVAVCDTATAHQAQAAMPQALPAGQ